MINHITLEGRLFKDANDLNKSKAGKSYISFGLCVSRGKEENPMFINVTAFGFNAENVAKFGKKGSTIIVSGNLAPIYSSQNKQTGINLLADQITIVPKRNEEFASNVSEVEDVAVYPWD
jgi:single-strand DNA-binding protein